MTLPLENCKAIPAYFVDDSGNKITSLNPLPTSANLINTLDISNGTGIIIPAAVKSFQAVLTGTGAIAGGVSIQCSNTDSNYSEIANLALSGTTSVIMLQTIQTAFKYTKAVISSLTGTGAACVVTVSY